MKNKAEEAINPYKISFEDEEFLVSGIRRSFRGCQQTTLYVTSLGTIEAHKKIGLSASPIAAFYKSTRNGEYLTGIVFSDADMIRKEWGEGLGMVLFDIKPDIILGRGGELVE